MALIEVEDVWRIFRMGEVEVPALRGVTLRIERGEFVVIMGASGSGKSTLMAILGGLDRPTRGRYLLDGLDMASLPARELANVRNRRVGYVFQSFQLLPRTSAIENVELPLLYGPARSAAERRALAQEALERVGLADRMHHFPGQLSGGQQQRAAIARALVNRPSILFADEPTGNLDTKASAGIMELLQGLNDAEITVVMVTHEPDVARYGKRKVVLSDGGVQSDEPIADRIETGHLDARRRTITSVASSRSTSAVPNLSTSAKQRFTVLAAGRSRPSERIFRSRSTPKSSPFAERCSITPSV
jgi:putative ABC transport system ATP-binding protein